MRNKGQVKFRVTGDEGVGGQESSASDLVGVLKDLVGTTDLASRSKESAMRLTCSALW